MFIYLIYCFSGERCVPWAFCFLGIVRQYAQKNPPNIQRLKFWIIFADNFCNLGPSVLNERLKDIYLSWFFGKSGKVIGGALV